MPLNPTNQLQEAFLLLEMLHSLQFLVLVQLAIWSLAISNLLNVFIQLRQDVT